MARRRPISDIEEEELLLTCYMLNHVHVFVYILFSSVNCVLVLVNNLEICENAIVIERYMRKL